MTGVKPYDFVRAERIWALVYVALLVGMMPSAASQSYEGRDWKVETERWK
jgi:hypothetical protein